MRKLLLFALLSPLLSMCQPLSIRGKVISEGGVPVPGATVTLRPALPGPAALPQVIQAGEKGTFTLTGIHIGDTIVVTAVGYQTAREVIDYATRDALTVILSRSTALLDEVTVSTGYQQLPKERTTGSFTQLSSKLLQQQVTTSILDKLPAITTGLVLDRRTASPGLILRGLSTIRGVRGPLIVLDNFPYEGDIRNINPNDVESITVLKDAAAASVWGTRAANGVIVITTRQGRFSQPLTIDLTSSYTVVSKPDLFYTTPMASADVIAVEQMLFSNGFYNSRLTASNRPPLSPVVELLLQKAAGAITPAQAAAQLEEWSTLDVRNDFNRYLYQEGRNRQVALSLRGGAARNTWLLSVGYDNNENELAATYRRLNLRTENRFRLSKTVTLSAGMYVTGAGSGSGRPAYGEVSSASGLLPPYTRLADDAGNALPVGKNYRQLYIDTVGGGKLLNWSYYPLTDYHFQHLQTDVSDLVLNTAVQVALLPTLNVDLKYQHERQATRVHNQYDAESYFARDLVNQFTQLNRATGAVTYKVPPGAILDQAWNELAAHSGRAQLSWDQPFRRHRIIALAGAEVRQTTLTSTKYRTYGYDPDILTFSQVDFTTRYPTFVSGSTAFIPNSTGISGKLNRFVSFYGNGAYTYNDRYTASFSARRDASNVFGIKTNEKWTPLWSAGLSWNLSSEAFYHSNALPYLKLRTTYGYSGNADESRSALTIISYLSASPYTLAPYANINTYANPRLRWEKVHMMNWGIDFKTAGERITGSLDYFTKRAFDLFGPAETDYTTGVGSTMARNVASMKGRGYDVEVNTLNTKGRVQWTTTLNFSTYTDKVTDYFLASQQGSNFVGSTAPSITGQIGRPLYSVYAYRWAGLDPQNGDPRGYLGDTISKAWAALTGSGVTVNDLAYIGPSLPTVYGSLGNTLTWKGLSISARVLYKFGFYIRKSSINYGSLYNALGGHADFALRWQKPGDELVTNVPSMVYPSVTARDAFYNGSEATITRGDHIRLQYINLSWQLTRQQFARLPVAQCQFYINLSDLGILWRANPYAIDPDYPINGIPPSRSMTLGCRITL